MPSYDVETDFNLKDGAITVSPGWVIAVVRLANQVTFDRNKSTFNRSFSQNPSDGVKERGGPLIIVSDCVSVSVSTSKPNHVATMNATLLHGEAEYLTEIYPSDWVLVWMVEDEQKVETLINKIKQKQPANGPHDGLKFVGRIDSIRKIRSIERTSGMMTSRYALTASAFSELDSKILYDAKISKKEQFGEWVANINTAVNQLVYTDDARTHSKGQLDINKIIPLFITIFLGQGPPLRSKDPTGKDQLQLSPNAAYLVPQTVGDLLGRKANASPSGNLTYVDLLDTILGVQHYSDRAGASGSLGIFTPDGIETVDGTIKKTAIPLTGEFYPSIPPFNSIPVWSILQQYLNPAVNEMYTCMRMNQDGNVVPTLMVRQMPFTTELGAKRAANQPTQDGLGHPTRFLELPRWKLSNSLVWDMNVGRSNANRFNYVVVETTAPVNQTDQRVRNPPLRDDIDIVRSSLRPYTITVNCSLKAAKVGATEWTQHLTDYLMGQHLTLNGTLTVVGIELPICEGDNLEFDGVIYHIEGVQHSCAIDPTGRKNFETNLFLTHGMAGSDQFFEAGAVGLSDDAAQYPFMVQDSVFQHDPVSVVENRFDTSGGVGEGKLVNDSDQSSGSA